MKRNPIGLMSIFSVFFLTFILNNQVASQRAYESEAWVSTGGPIGGLGYDIRYNFDDPTIWYVTDAWAGFFISTDNGLTWSSSNNGITARKGPDAIPIFCATVDPHEPSTIWIGTENTGDIFKSVDGGATWELKRNGVPLEQQFLTFRGFTVDPRTSDIVYAMAEIGSPAWTPDGLTKQGIEMDMTMGVVYKTIDGGENWIEKWRGNNLARYCWINPRDPEVIYVSTGIFDRESANTDTAAGIAGGVGILKSINGGDDWQVLNEKNGLLDHYIGSLFMHPEHPDTLLAAAGQNNWSGYHGAHTGGVYITTDGGETWTRVIDTHEMFLVVEYSTTDPDIAYAFSPEAVYRSEDAGFNWERFSRTGNMWGPEGIVVGFPIDAQCDPRNPMRIIVNNYLGGNILSEDGGETWTLASKGYSGALVSHLVVIQDSPHIVYAGSRSGIYRSDNGGEDWIGLCNPPDSMFAKFNEIRCVAVDPDDPDHVLTMPNDFASTLYSYDGGSTWEVGTQTGAINSMRFAPSDPSIVYATTDTKFWTSTDDGEHFQAGTEDAMIALVVHPTNAQIVYVSSVTRGLLKSIDGGQTWDEVGEGLPEAAANTLAIHPLNPALMFAGISDEMSLGGKGVYRSLDGGDTWTQQGGGMDANALVTSVVVDPNDVNVVYACDHLSGVYVSTNGGDFWQAINQNLNHRTMNALALSGDGSVLYAATMGAGVYRLGDVEVSDVVDRTSEHPSTFLLEPNYPNPFNPVTSIRYTLPEKSHVTIQIMNMRGRLVHELVNSKQSAGSHIVRWDGTDQQGHPVSSGIYLCRMVASSNQRLRKMTLIR